MSSRTPATTTMPLGAALDQSEPLARLLQRLRESNACFDAVRPLLPAGLLEQVRAGPLDDEGWTLLVSNGAAAAKLRQMIPRLEEAVAARRQQATPIRMRVSVPPG